MKSGQKHLKAFRLIFGYQSKYKVFQETRQGNGLILMITHCFTGLRFLLFSLQSIIYFRHVCGSWTRTGRAYHRSLHVLGGFTKKNGIKFLRHQLTSYVFFAKLSWQ